MLTIALKRAVFSKGHDQKGRRTDGRTAASLNATSTFVLGHNY